MKLLLIVLMIASRTPRQTPLPVRDCAKSRESVMQFNAMLRNHWKDFADEFVDEARGQ